MTPPVFPPWLLFLTPALILVNFCLLPAVVLQFRKATVQFGECPFKGWAGWGYSWLVAAPMIMLAALPPLACSAGQLFAVCCLFAGQKGWAALFALLPILTWLLQVVAALGMAALLAGLAVLVSLWGRFSNRR